jgi:phospholipid/cholesterol/gamma-HCH transport system permease protein
MEQARSSLEPLGGPWGRLRDWALGWWRIVHLGAVLTVLALSPGTYHRGVRRALARELVGGTAPMLVGFGLVSALASLVLIRIVVVTALSYGLSRYALEMVVRVLVLELIPLAAALFVAMRYSVPQGVLLARSRVGAAPARSIDVETMRTVLLPPAFTAMLSVLALAAVSGVIALVIAYLLVHGFTPWGLESYTRTVGHVLGPAVGVIFVLKTLGFGLAVALVPVASAVHDAPAASSRAGAELRALTRLAALILGIEALSLVGNYF